MILPDVIRPGLRVVFCGTAAGEASARAGAYYAGPGNRFWPTLHEIGMTRSLLAPSDFPRLLDEVTDLCKLRSGSDRTIGTGGFDVARLHALIERHRPALLAFNGKRAAEHAVGQATSYGAQAFTFAGARLFVLPSTSGAARRFWDVRYWQELAVAATPRSPAGTPLNLIPAPVNTGR
jgi:TDG/mug DNA glycosylase family protein